MVIDKKKAQKNMYRTSEKFIFILCFLGASLGVYIGMYTVRHKTKKLIFTVGVPVIFILNIMTIFYLLTTNILKL